MFDSFTDPRFRNKSTSMDFPKRTIDAPWGDDEVIVIGNNFVEKEYWFIDASINGEPKKKYLIENGEHYFNYFGEKVKNGFVASRNVNKTYRPDSIYSLYWYENGEIHRNGMPASGAYFGEDKSYKFKWSQKGNLTCSLEAKMNYDCAYHCVYSEIDENKNNPEFCDNLTDLLTNCMKDFWEYVKCVQ